MIAFARRNAWEILRDAPSLGFGLGFPLILLALMTLIQRNVPVEIFQMESLLPGICVFGESFFALFSAQLISKDRSSALMMRLSPSPPSVCSDFSSRKYRSFPRISYSVSFVL